MPFLALGALGQELVRETRARSANAGDDPGAVEIAAQLVRDVGCEPTVVGDLSAATCFQRGGPAVRANTDATELRRLLGPSDQ